MLAIQQRNQNTSFTGELLFPPLLQIEFLFLCLSSCFHRYLICPEPPYKPIARSELFNVRTPDYYSNHNMTDVTVSFALGLALEGDMLYISWSENDNNPILSAWKSSHIYDLLKNSSLSPSLLKESHNSCGGATK